MKKNKIVMHLRRKNEYCLVTKRNNELKLFLLALNILGKKNKNRWSVGKCCMYRISKLHKRFTIVNKFQSGLKEGMNDVREKKPSAIISKNAHIFKTYTLLVLFS